MTDRLLLDHSAWARFRNPSLPGPRIEELAEAIEQRRLVVSLPFLLEAGFSPRNQREHEEVLAELLALPRVHIEATIENRALAVQRQLARIGHHRLPPVDLILAALADRHEIGILHYDADFDVLAEKTDLEFESIWLAPRGSL